MNPTPGPLPLEWFWWLSAAVVTFSGVGVVLWALLWDRARGRQRCPKCWYDMAGAKPLEQQCDQATERSGSFAVRCSECGKLTKREKKLSKTRRKWRWALAGTLLTFTAPGLYAYDATRNGFWQALPDWALVGIVQVQGWPEPSIVARTSPSVVQTNAKDELYARIQLSIVSESTLRWIFDHAYDGSFEIRGRWPEDVPIFMRIRHSSRCMSFIPWSYRLRTEPGIIVRGGRGVEANWIGRTTFYEFECIPVSPKNQEVVLEAVLLIPDTQYSPQYPSLVGQTWKHRTTKSVKLVKTVEDILDPVDDPVVTDYLFESLRFAMDDYRDLRGLTLHMWIGHERFQQPEEGVSPGAPPSPPGKYWPAPRKPLSTNLQEMAFGFCVELRKSGETVASAHHWATDRDLFDYRRVRFSSDHTALADADFSDPAWTLHIIGDGEMALRDFDKTKYWAGEFSIPMSEVEIRRTQR